MNFAEYVELSSRTFPDDMESPLSLAILTLGICGEIPEFLDAENLQDFIKEAGDVCWYLAAITRRLNLEENEIIVDEIEEDAIRRHLTSSQGAIAEHIKKYLGHGKTLDKSFVQFHRDHIRKYVQFEMERAGVPIDAVYQANVDKLRKRWANGFMK